MSDYAELCSTRTCGDCYHCNLVRAQAENERLRIALAGIFEHVKVDDDGECRWDGFTPYDVQYVYDIARAAIASTPGEGPAGAPGEPASPGGRDRGEAG